MSIEAVAQEFVRNINAHDVMGLGRLMTEDHQFIDATGAVHPGRAAMVEGWKKYFSMFPDYQVNVEDTVVQDDRVVMFGHASGAFEGKPETAFSVPVCWKATIRGGSVVEWRVYCDAEPIFKAMGQPRT
ncbi:MAG: nuclear transport factor 2 family protein [Candidatus Xenobia bacterium]